MDLFLQGVVEGLVLGSAYALIAMGFTLVFGVLGVLNVAQADFYMTGAYASWVTLTVLGGGLAVALLTSAATGVVAAIVIYVVVLKRIPLDQPLAVFIATLGISMALQNGVARIEGPDDRSYPSLLSPTFHDVGPVQVSVSQLLVVGMMIAFFLALVLWIKKTAMGREIRAVSENRGVAQALGVNVRFVLIATLIVACVMAGVTGFAFGNLFGSISPFMSQSMALKMFIVALVAGTGSFGGVVAVGLGLGVLESLTVIYIGSGWQDMGGFAVLVLVLLLRPQGVFGSAVRTA